MQCIMFKLTFYWLHNVPLAVMPMQCTPFPVKYVSRLPYSVAKQVIKIPTGYCICFHCLLAAEVCRSYSITRFPAHALHHNIAIQGGMCSCHFVIRCCHAGICSCHPGMCWCHVDMRCCHVGMCCCHVGMCCCHVGMCWCHVGIYCRHVGMCCCYLRMRWATLAFAVATWACAHATLACTVATLASVFATLVSIVATMTCAFAPALPCADDTVSCVSVAPVAVWVVCDRHISRVFI